jgi:hypothetical protein
MASESARSRQTTPGVKNRLANVQGALGRALGTASGPARLAQLQRRAKAAQAGAEGILNRRAAGEKAGTITANVPILTRLRGAVGRAAARLRGGAPKA